MNTLLYCLIAQKYKKYKKTILHDVTKNLAKITYTIKTSFTFSIKTSLTCTIRNIVKHRD